MKKKTKIVIAVTSVLVLCITSISLGYYFIVYKPKVDHNNELRRIAQEYYDNKVKQFEEENKNIGEIDVCFLGDSLTDGYDVKSYDPEFKVVNRGIGGDTTVGLQKRLKVSAYDINPKVVTMLIGANNMSEMLDNYESILIDFQDNIPQTKIVSLSLTSMGKEWGRKNELAKQNNEVIKSLAEKYNYSYVDLFNPLLNNETGMIYDEYTTDGGHLTPKGYGVVTDQIKPVLTELLK